MASRCLKRSDRLVKRRFENRDVQHVALDGGEYGVLSVSESYLERVLADRVPTKVARHAAVERHLPPLAARALGAFHNGHRSAAHRARPEPSQDVRRLDAVRGPAEGSTAGALAVYLSGGLYTRLRGRPERLVHDC